MKRALSDELFVLNGRWLFDSTSHYIVSLTDSRCVASLSPAGAQFLSSLVRSPQTIVHYGRMVEEPWALEARLDHNRLEQIADEVRQAIVKLDPSQTYFKTLPRLGYVLVVDARPHERNRTE